MSPFASSTMWYATESSRKEKTSKVQEENMDVAGNNVEDEREGFCR